jgi:glycosyltransferase involved in cell wall biosynthesis
MRVAYLNPGATLGGAELSLLDILASLPNGPDGIEPYLIVGQEGPLIQRARDLGVRVSVLEFPASLARLGDAGVGGKPGISLARAKLTANLARAGAAVIGYSRRLRRELERIAPDLVHTNGFKMHVLGARATPPPVPLIWHVRDFLSSRPVMARFLRGYAQRPALVIANSRAVADDVRAVLGDGVRIETVYNAIDLDQFSPDGDALDLDGMAGLPPVAEGTVRVGLPATLARWKGHEVFLRAISLLSPELPVRGYVIGDAIYQTSGSQHQLSELREFAAVLNLPSGRIGFTGYTDRPAAAIRALDIVVHASTQPEPFGRVVAEAMACGRAVIVSRAGGVTEIVEEGVDALAHTPGDAAELAGKMETLVRDAAMRERLGQVGRRTAEKRFGRARLAGEVEALYREVVKRQPPH